MDNLQKQIHLFLYLFCVFLGFPLFVGCSLANQELLREVTFSSNEIVPGSNNQGQTLIKYSLSNDATVSIFFENEAGERFYFRKEQFRARGDYQVSFRGIVRGYKFQEEVVPGEVITRLLPDGIYTWTILALEQNGNLATYNGQILITESDNSLPLLLGFELDAQTFSPNQDGFNDEVTIQFQLEKESEVTVYLTDLERNIVDYVSEYERDVPAGAPGRHYYIYTGGVELSATPPNDGKYFVIASAEDRLGQIVQVESTLTITNGGVPRADIISPLSGDTLELSSTSVQLCDTLYFTATVRNYGNIPIRTSGPTPGLVYDSSWNYNTVGWPTESGAWRFAIGYDKELKHYPYRWSLGNVQDLEEIEGQYYLMPGATVVINGGIRIVDTFGELIWAGLIHEDVGISQFNDKVGLQEIQVEGLSEEFWACTNRTIPTRPQSDE